MKKRTGEPWMPADEYGRSLRGAGVNLVVANVARSVVFLTEVLGLEEVYSDPDLAVLRHGGHDLLVHAEHTYVDEDGVETSFLLRTKVANLRGAGVELRLYGIDPDAAEERARTRGDVVIAASTDKPHGLRECYIVDPDGYVWVPGTATPG